MHESFQFEQDQRYNPVETIDNDELDEILKDRLDFIFPPSDVKTMTNMQKARWYGGDGVVKAFDFLTKKSYGSQSIQKEETKKGIRAQQVINKKAKRQLGVHQKVMFNHPDSDGSASTSSAPPSNQLSVIQKRPRALSSAVDKDAPQHKKGKYTDDTTSSEGIEDPQPRQINKSKGKELVSDRDEDEEMSTDPPTSNGSEGQVLVPNSDDDIDMGTESPAAGSGDISPPP